MSITYCMLLVMSFVADSHPFFVNRPAINIPGSTSQRVIDALELEGPRIERAYQRYFKRCVPDQKDEQRAVNESDTYNANTNNESSLQKDIARENPAEADSNSRKSDSLHEFEIM